MSAEQVREFWSKSGPRAVQPSTSTAKVAIDAESRGEPTRTAGVRAEPAAALLDRSLGPLAGRTSRIVDSMLLLGGLLLAAGSYVYMEPPSWHQLLNTKISVKHLVAGLLGWGVWAFSFWVSGLHRGSRHRTVRQLSVQVVLGSTICTIIATLSLLTHFRGSSLVGPLLLFWLSSIVALLAIRGVQLWYARKVRPRMREGRRAIIVGAGQRGQQLALTLPSHQSYRFEVLGYIDSTPQRMSDGTNVPLMGSFDDLEAILMREQVDEVFITLPMRSKYEDIGKVISFCEAAGVQSQYPADLFQTSVMKRRGVDGDDAERIVMHMVHVDYRRYIKRAFDLTVAAAGLLILAPVMLSVALLIRLTSQGPAIFKQQRYGLNKRLFFMYKFRSMVVDAEARQAELERQNESGGPVFKIRRDPRITSIGRFIRRTSIDELPQLVNVLFGDMSLVGPRPLPMRDVSRFSEASLMRRFSVKPGMTGLWQVSGRSDTSFGQWIQLDLDYIDHWSLRMDGRILLKTFSAVMRGTGAS